MKRGMSVDGLLKKLGDENIQTWFDLGLFIDRFKEDSPLPLFDFNGKYDDFKKSLKTGGIAFITYHYMVDGVTVEAEKYAELFRRNIPGVPIHFVAGSFKSKSETLIHKSYSTCEIPILKGFDEWDLYNDFFHTDLERGGKKYNELIIELWDQTLTIIHELGGYIEKNGINLLYLINVCSNPGNIALSLAAVLISEFMEIPVINNNHDFYWEGGHSKIEREKKGHKRGPRDFFFRNAHLGEVFTIIELLFPWESRTWINVNINQGQSDHLIRTDGHNPASVMEIATAVDTKQYTKSDKRRNINTFLQVEKILSKYKNRLICYSVEDVFNNRLVSETNPRPILIGGKTKPIKHFISENIIFLQPTRIISRKRIEVIFELILKMFDQPQLKSRFESTPNLKLTLLVSGPIASGHYEYFEEIVNRFREMLDLIDPLFHERFFMGLLLGELDKEAFIQNVEEPMGIHELYNIASLVLLPSKTEGRGLPIIEATACGTPIFCRRYYPETVYSEVIGEHLSERDRLKVLEFKGNKISGEIVRQIIDRVFFPHKFAEETAHNKRVVQRRYSLDALNENVNAILYRLYQQLLSNDKVYTEALGAISEYRDMINFRNEDLAALLDTSSRHYLPGYGRLSFMLLLKSLIDPSYFRVEQKKVRGMAFHFARAIVMNDPEFESVPPPKVLKFYNAVDTLFHIKDGESRIRHDHALSYRHRNKNHYPYQELTFQELTGLINLLYIKIIQPVPANKVDLSPQFFTDWNLALQQLTGSTHLAIDNRALLIDRLQTNLPIAYFPGEYLMYELEFFALQSIRSRLKLPIEEALTREHVRKNAKQLAPIYIFSQEKNLGKQLNKDEIENFIVKGDSAGLKLLYDFKIVRIVRTKQLCVGIHFPQLGEAALNILRKVKEQGGYLLTNRRNAALMTDIVDIERFHIGKVFTEFTSNIMGLPIDSGYIQHVPAGVRTTLTYPTPIQTAKTFNDVVNSDLYKNRVAEMGEEAVLNIIKKDASEKGSPLKHVLENIKGSNSGSAGIAYEYISGVFNDGLPYNGAIARVNLFEANWKFKSVSTQTRPKTVVQFVQEFNNVHGKNAEIAWNGGYILNPELVGKLGLPESYIGSPLGLLISENKVISPPLFNKAALLIDVNGNIEISRVNCSGGIVISSDDWRAELTERNYNRTGSQEDIIYFDLLSDMKEINGDGRVIVRLAGNVIKEIKRTALDERIDIIPVGLTLSFTPDVFPGHLAVGDELSIQLPGMEGVLYAIEAGPMLLHEGVEDINMLAEGWKTKHSIHTQAARLDYLDMRGPKIAAGIDEKGNLIILTINGRIRESVGATHGDMAVILKSLGLKSGMGFDPGGSSTLVVGEKEINISPYNSKYEENVYALPPMPRAVSNAIIGFIE